ncbi:hypothetical protein DMH27_05950 [Raoultella planticola]|nr:hypothetical protein [Raoultella planticola]
MIALLGEYDALAGLSQQAHCAHPLPQPQGRTATAVVTICWAPRRWPPPLPAGAGWRSTAVVGRFVSTAVRVKKAVPAKRLWCAKDCLTMWTPR